MKMQSFLLRISLILLLGNSSLLLFGSGKVSANSNISDGNCSDCSTGNPPETNDNNNGNNGSKPSTGGPSPGPGPVPVQNSGQNSGSTNPPNNGSVNNGSGPPNGAPNNNNGNNGSESPTGGTSSGTGPGTVQNSKPTDTTGNGDGNALSETPPEAGSERAKETETKTAETAETAETGAASQATQATPIDAPGDTVSAPQVEFAAPTGEVNSPTQAAVENVIAQLGAGTLGSGDGAGGAGGISVPPSIQQTILALLTGDPTTKSLFGDPALNPLIKALGEGGAGQLSAWKLAESLLGLLRDGKVDGKKLLAAVTAYNALVKASNDEFLLNPPAELVAIRAVLAELVSAAEAESRTPD
jgi:hypothetical protein